MKFILFSAVAMSLSSVLTSAAFVDFDREDRLDVDFDARFRFDGDVRRDDDRRPDRRDDRREDRDDRREDREERRDCHHRGDCHHEKERSCCGPAGFPGHEGRHGQNGRHGRQGRIISRDFGQIFNLPAQTVVAAGTPGAPAGKFIDFSTNGHAEDVFHTQGTSFVFVERTSTFLLTASIVAAAGSGPSLCSIYVNGAALVGPQYSFLVGTPTGALATTSSFSHVSLVELKHKSKLQIYCKAPNFVVLGGGLAPNLVLPASTSLSGTPNANLAIVALI